MKPNSIAIRLQEARTLLSRFDSAKLDAELLLAACLDVSRSYLYTWPEEEVSDEVLQKFTVLVNKRAKGEPVQYVLGRQDFYDLTLKVTPKVLIPRPETEGLVDFVLTSFSSQTDKTILDLGTGSGAIALALKKHRSNWQVFAGDSSEDALAVAIDNASTNKLDITFQVSDWYAAFEKNAFDIVISNPPYIAKEDEHLEQFVAAFEPQSALIAKDDGLSDIKEIVSNTPLYLKRPGLLVIEHGFAQQAAVQEIFTDAGFNQIHTEKDLQGHPRFTHGML